MAEKLLAGRVAVITGGSNGIGRATAVLFAEQGAHVTVGDLDQMPENMETFARLGIRSETCDVRDPESLKRLIDGAAALQSRLDVLVNNAGVGMVKQLDAVTEADWDACLDTNLKGAFFACKWALPWMIKAGGGSIINIASNAGLLPRAHDPVYSISKGAVVALTKSLGLCHAKDRIRVNAICPGPVERTRMLETDLLQHADPAAARRQLLEASPLVKAHGRLIAPEEVAQAALYLASDAAMMVSGTSLAIDGGKSLGVPPRSMET